MWPEIAEKAKMPKMSQSEKSAQQYGLVNKETGDVRTSNDKGNATLVNGEGGKNELNFTDWKPWAYTAGGGALAYLLAKKLFDDDDDEDGKKKGFIGTILPYLAAVGGGLGGYALSGVGNEAGQNGEVAFKIGPDGKVQMPDKPMSGKWLNRTGLGAMALGTVPGVRAIAKWVDARPARLQASAAMKLTGGATSDIASAREGIDRGLWSPSKTVEELAKKDLANADKILAARNGRMVPGNGLRWAEKLRRRVAGRGGMKGSVISALASILGGLGVNYVGDRMNDKYQAWKAVQKAFGMDKDVND